MMQLKWSKITLHNTMNLSQSYKAIFIKTNRRHSLARLVITHKNRLISITPSGLIILALIGIAALSSAIPCSLDYEALKRISPRKYGILICTEPTIATLDGITFLGDQMTFRVIIALLLVSISALGLTFIDKK